VTGSGRVAVLAFSLSFGVMLANGRAIGSGDTNVLEKTATALVERRTVVLKAEDGSDPFTRATADGGRISIYSPVPALIATPIFVAVSVFFDLNLTGIQFAGKLAAALVASTAIGLLASCFAQRTSPGLAVVSALIVGLGTSVFSTAQALWQHPAVLLFLVIAIAALERMEAVAMAADRSGPALVAAVALALAAVSRPATIPLCAVLFGFLLIRARPFIRRILLAAALPLLLIAAYNTTFFGAPWRFGPTLSGRFGAAFPESIAGLLLSPARGLLVFTPIAIVALWALIRQARRSTVARALLAAASAHFLFMALWNEWHGGESFGPRLLTDLVPALFFFLPEGLAAWPKTGVVLGFASVGAQMIGGWTYDYRWERLHQRGGEFESALWSWRDSPLAFAVREGVVIQGVPKADGRKLRLPLHRAVPFGPTGSIIESTSPGPRVRGTPLIRDIRLERGARITAGWMRLTHPGDALAFRSLVDGARTLSIAGFLQGRIRVENGSRVFTSTVAGDFAIEAPLLLESGEDVYVRAEEGELRVARVELR